MKFIITLCLFFSTLNPLNLEEEKISWNEEYKLTWSDFKATQQSINGSVASTSSGIAYAVTYTYDASKNIVDYSTQVSCNFYPYKSWYNKKDSSAYILKHEQTHFDISELFARKLKKQFSEINEKKNIDKKLTKIFYKVEEERQKTQIEFDNETNHSINKIQEKEWETYIVTQLKKYERWK